MSLTIPALFDAAVEEVPDKAWLLHEDLSFTYAEARERVARVAGALTERGIARGDLVLGTAHNRPEYVFTWLACAYLGAIWVPTDPRATEAELDGLIGQVQPVLVIEEPLDGEEIELTDVAREDDAAGRSPA